MGRDGLRTSLSPCSAAYALTGLVSSPYDACVAQTSEQRLSNRGRLITFICLVVYFLRNPVPVYIRRIVGAAPKKVFCIRKTSNAYFLFALNIWLSLLKGK